MISEQPASHTRRVLRRQHPGAELRRLALIAWEGSVPSAAADSRQPRQRRTAPAASTAWKHCLDGNGYSLQPVGAGADRAVHSRWTSYVCSGNTSSG